MPPACSLRLTPPARALHWRWLVGWGLYLTVGVGWGPGRGWGQWVRVQVHARAVGTGPGHSEAGLAEQNVPLTSPWCKGPLLHCCLPPPPRARCSADAHPPPPTLCRSSWVSVSASLLGIRCNADASSTPSPPLYAQVQLGQGRTVRLGGMAHGDARGLQAVVTCDAPVIAPLWQAIFERALARSFRQMALAGHRGGATPTGRCWCRGPGAGWEDWGEGNRACCG